MPLVSCGFLRKSAVSCALQMLEIPGEGSAKICFFGLGLVTLVPALKRAEKHENTTSQVRPKAQDLNSWRHRPTIRQLKRVLVKGSWGL